MKQYFKGPIRKISISKIEKDGIIINYKRKDKIAFNDKLFYYNYMGNLICDENKVPLFTEDEIDDVISFNFSENESLSNFEALYVNREELKKVDHKKKNKTLFKSRNKR